MTVKKSNIRREIDSQFEVEQNDDEDFENPFADAVQNLISSDIQPLSAEDISGRLNSLRTRTFNEDANIQGKSTSRNKLFKHYFNSLEQPDNDVDSDESKDDSEVPSLDDGSKIEDEQLEDESETEDEELGDESEVEDDDSQDEDGDYSMFGSNDGDLNNTKQRSSKADVDDAVEEDFLYSKQCTSSEIEKGLAVQQQIGLWDTFLECRIRLQKGLVAFNKFPTEETVRKYNLTNELKTEFQEAQHNLTSLMDTLISLHEKLYQQCEGSSQNILKRKIPHSQDCRKGTFKKIKLNEYATLLDEMHSGYIPFRNTVIQKWNDKTKIASGKLGNSNFSAFDQSVVQQINHILNDKSRLIRRTQQRKSKYQRVGAKKEVEPGSKDEEYDSDIFDDDDFYHKVLRDYIEKKTIDVNDPRKLGKQWMELQKLRSKMKRKVDVKCTKGRKLRYGVHEKLINFMAPIISHQWNPESETELFKSLFGTRK